MNVDEKHGTGHRARRVHVHVILRLDFYDDDALTIQRDTGTWTCVPGHEPLPPRITATKAYYSEVDAQQEADRLNALNLSKGCRYFVVLARLEQRREDGLRE